MLPKKITPETLVELALRRWWLLAGPLVLALMVALALAVTLPRLYQSETTILVQPQEVPTSYVTPTVTYDLENRLQAMSQQIMSRTRLLEITKEFNLYPELAKQPEEDVVDQTRRSISIELGGKEKHGNQEVSFFKLGFAHPKPETARQVTARLASLFIEENLQIRAQQAKLTTEFLEKELEDMKAKLQTQEQTLSTYKQRFMGALPEQLQSNLNALSSLQTELQTNQVALSAAEERALLIQKALSEAGSAQAAATAAGSPGLPTGSPEARLTALRQALPQLESRYTPKHPAVVKAKKEIAALEAELAQSPSPEAAAEEPKTSSANQRGLSAPLVAVRYEIERLKQNMNASRGKIAVYQRRVEATPQREQELATLTRDYEMMQANYQSLLKKHIDAKMAENLESKQQGEQFRMIDPPNLPERPFKPDLRKLFSLAVLLGLGTGLGLTLVLEYMDRSFKAPEELEEFLHLNILATLPLIRTAEQVQRQRRRKLLVAVGCGLVLVVYAGLLAYAHFRGLTFNLPLLT